MGIEVWRVRSVAPSPVPQQVTNHDPAFHLSFLNYRTIAMCVTLDPDDEVISPEARQFCDDVALAFNGSRTQAVFSNLKWPTKDGDQSAAEILRHRINALPGILIIFGAREIAHLPEMAGLKEGHMAYVEGRRILLTAAVSEVCAAPASKKALWRHLQSAISKP